MRAAARASAGGGAIFVAEVCAFSVVPRFEVAVLNRKFVAAESAAIASNHNHVLLTWVRGRCFGIKAHSTRSTKGEGQQLQGTGRRPSAIAGTTDSRPSTLERYDESAFCCSRVGHAACQPDLRSDRQQSDLWRLRLGTKLPLLWCESITPVVRGSVSRNTHDSRRNRAHEVAGRGCSCLAAGLPWYRLLALIPPRR